MTIQDPLTGLIIGCSFRVAMNWVLAFWKRFATSLLVNFGRAKIQVRRLSMSRGTETGDVNLKVDEVQ